MYAFLRGLCDVRSQLSFKFLYFTQRKKTNSLKIYKTKKKNNNTKRIGTYTTYSIKKTSRSTKTHVRQDQNKKPSDKNEYKELIRRFSFVRPRNDI